MILEINKIKFWSKKGEVSPSLLKGFTHLGIVLVMVAVGAFFPTKTYSADNWYDYDWLYRKQITVDHTRVVNTSQSNFPVLVSLTDTDLRAHAQDDGYDILFTDVTGTTKIPYEREQYASGSGTLVAWVNIETLSHLTDTVIYLYYGNSEADDQQDMTGGVWDANFKGVWHSQDASSTTIADSTINGNTGIKFGEAGPAEVTGKVGKAQSYNGADEYVGTATTESLAGSFTVSVWAKVSDGEDRTIIGTRGGSDNSFDFKFSAGETMHGDIGDGDAWITNEADTGLSYSYDTWYQIAYVVTATGYTIYIDGTNVGSGSYDESVPLLLDAGHSLCIGQVGYDEEWFYGSIDEVKISDIVRSADWIGTEYNNQNDPTTFYSVGDEVVGDETVPSAPGMPESMVSDDLTEQVWSWTASTDTGTGVSHYHWQVDDGPSGIVTATTVTTNLAGGNWKFHLKAEDGAGNQSSTQSASLSIFSTSSSQVAIDNSVPVVWVVVPADVSNPILDLSSVVVSDGERWVANINTEIHVRTLLSSSSVVVSIPSGVTMTGSAHTWTKVFVPPIAVTGVTVPAPSGFTSQVSLAVLVGHDVASLEITKGARLFLEGQAGNQVGYVTGGVFTEVTNVCAEDSQVVGDDLEAGQSCKIDVGSDLVIWTKHFTKFVTYTIAQNPPSSGASMPVEWYGVPKEPVGGFNVVVNDGAGTTSSPAVNLKLTGGSDTARVAISNSSDFSGAVLDPYVAEKEWNLCWRSSILPIPSVCPAGTYTVYVKYYTSWGTVSRMVSDTIKLKTSNLIPVSPIVEPTKKIADLPFVSSLKFGQISNDVKRLQMFLNQDPDTQLAKSGVGSPGKETSFFGILTKMAVIEFQEKYAGDILAPWGLTKGTGLVGRTTLAKINAMFGT